MQFLGFRTHIYLRKTNKQDIIYKQGKKLLFFQFQIRESKHVQFEEKGGDNPYVYTGLDRKRSHPGEGHCSDPCTSKASEGENDTLTIQEDADYIPLLQQTVG